MWDLCEELCMYVKCMKILLCKVLGSSLSRIQGYPQDEWRRREKERERERPTDQTGRGCSRFWQIFIFHSSFYILSYYIFRGRKFNITSSCPSGNQGVSSNFFVSVLYIIFWPRGLLT